MTALISTWKELSEVPDSDTHTIKINEEIGATGFVYELGKDEPVYYLSSHTFYEKTHKYRTKMLKSFGFDVTIQSWGN